MRRLHADLFHFHVPHPTGEMAYLLSGLATPAVATYHSDVVRQRLAMKIYAPFFQRFLSRMRVIMPTSQRYLETSEPLAAHRARCRVVPLGYPLDDYESTPEIERRAAELRARHGDFILFLGCLRAYKGLEFLLRALATLPGVQAVIAGEGAQGPALKQLAGELGLEGRVHFAGRVGQAEAVALLHGAALFVLPACQRSEAFGLCQIEAMACGLPVISTNLPTGVPEVNRHGVSGLIVPPADPAALAEAIQELMSDEARRRELGEAGRRRAREFYRAERMAADVAAVYREAMEQGGGGKP
jgi:rhamnosyl/mannosyltransferase